jgi:hypothetical protein
MTLTHTHTTLSHTHTLTHTHSHSHTLTHSHSHTLTLSLTHTHTHSLTLTHTHTLTHTPHTCTIRSKLLGLIFINLRHITKTRTVFIPNKLHCHLYVQLFALSYNFWKTSVNSSFWTFLNSSVTFLGSQQHPQIGVILTAFQLGEQKIVWWRWIWREGGDKVL